MKAACVIGAGFGGLALAIRLQAAGIATTLIDARDAPGGAAHTVERGGFAFAGGPTLFPDRTGFEELWATAGGDFDADVRTEAVDPLARMLWPDGTAWDMPAGEAAMEAAVATLAPGDLAGYQDFAALARRAKRHGWASLAEHPMLSWRAAVGGANMLALARLQPWHSVDSRLAGLVDSEKLRQALGAPLLLAGANPMSAEGLYAGLHAMLREGVWRMPGQRGITGAAGLAAAMAALFTQAGGTLRLGDAAVKIHTLGTAATEVEAASGWRERFDAVASGADLVHTYGTLLGDARHGRPTARRLARQAWSPGVFTLHFGLAGSFPALAEHTVLFASRWEGLLSDIFEHGVLPRDAAFTLHHASAVDPGAAPPGASAFTATMLVPHLGQLPVDWAEVAPLLSARIRAAVAARLIPDLADRLVTQCHFAPPDYARQFCWHRGAAWSLAPLLSQIGPARPRHRDPQIGNLYLVGAGTHPGAGVPAVLAGAKATAALMVEHLA